MAAMKNSDEVVSNDLLKMDISISDTLASHENVLTYFNRATCKSDNPEVETVRLAYLRLVYDLSQHMKTMLVVAEMNRGK